MTVATQAFLTSSSLQLYLCLPVSVHSTCIILLALNKLFICVSLKLWMYHFHYWLKCKSIFFVLVVCLMSHRPWKWKQRTFFLQISWKCCGCICISHSWRKLKTWSLVSGRGKVRYFSWRYGADKSFKDDWNFWSKQMLFKREVITIWVFPKFYAFPSLYSP